LSKNKALFFVLFLAFFSPLNSCYLCTIIDPNVYAYTKIFADDKQIQYIEVHWKFSKLYAFMSAQNYDKNVDAQIDTKELQEVKKDFFALLEENIYNTHIKINKKKLDIKGKIFDKQLFLSYKKLESSFKIHINFPLQDLKTLKIDYIDKNELLAFFVKDDFLVYNFPRSLKLTTNASYESLPLEISFKNIKPSKTEQKKQKPKISTFVFLAQILQDLSHKINKMLVDIKNKNSPFALFVLLGFSFLYGVVHAAGPGHGKSLVASYMLSHKKNIAKALSMSLFIGFVHIFSAFLMTFGIYFVLNEFFSNINNIELVVTKLSGVLIIAIASYMLQKKLQIAKVNKKFKFSLHPQKCSCSACSLSSNTTDIGIIIGAGIIPCPGTVTIFIFTLSLKTYFAGFLSALVMSFGMSIVIFLTAVFSICFRKSVEKSKLIGFMDYFGTCFILLLGLFLLLF